jgi:hypothetical protein
LRIRAAAKVSEADFAIYMYILRPNTHIHLLFLLDKGEQEDLTAEQQKEIRALVADLKARGRK